MRQQVDLVDEDEVARPEHERVLERLVLALRDRRHHDSAVLADAKLGRTDEVAHVRDHEQVDLVEREVAERRAHHVGIEMALAAEARIRVQLRDGNVEAGQAIGVHRALHVALEHADPNAGQAAHDALQQGGLSAPARS
jgi:hypothetical protein